VRRLVLLLTLVWLAAGCGLSRGARGAESELGALRDQGPSTKNPELAGQWLLAELISRGGEAKSADKARAHLDELGKGGMLANLARGMDDAVHGRSHSAPEHYLEAVRAARVSDDPRAPLVAWFAASRAVALEGRTAELWTRWRGFVESALAAPMNIGWRARAELVEWWADQAYSDARKNIEQETANAYGCVRDVRLAGPFGRGVAPDVRRAFPAEKPGPWPERWNAEPGAGGAPHVLGVKREGCFVRSNEQVDGGIFYAESFLDLEGTNELLVAVQGALALFIDDEQVLDRDPRLWGVWPKFGVQVSLGPGRHRIVARLAGPETSVRLLYPDGRPAKVKTESDASAPYSVVPPRITGEPNVVSRYVKNGDVVDPGDDLTRFLAAYLAYVEGQGDISAVLLEPLLKETRKATGLTLAASALFAEKDPIFDATSVQDLSRELHERAVKKDPKLWQSQLALALWQGQRAGPTEAATRLKQLSREFPEVSAIPLALARLYGELGWSAEYSALAKDLAQRFPNDTEALTPAIAVYESEGATDKADALVARIRQLDPDSELELTRALARADYPAALAELKRLGARHPERKDIAERIYDVMVRAGNKSETWKKLEAAIEKQPLEGRARLALADAHLAAGERDALRKALVEAIVKGANTVPLEEALDLVEGMTELEHYRLDARKIIRDFEKSGITMPGTAARVLDYAAIWVHADGSSRMLEHEVVKIQSPEAVGQLAEHPKVDGVVLHERVIKQDGRVLEPEEVPGKPTATYPHLEVGDYVETEHVVSKPSDDRGGQYLSPQWFFREENIAYARSEYVVITPEGKNLVVETRGTVPAPVVETKDGVVIRRWRVDRSPAAPAEPGSPPATEVLPSVRVGWGVDLHSRLRDLADSLMEMTPVDPRVARIARKVVAPTRPRARFERAQKLYRWVLANVEDGPETDGRRVVVSKRGNRWRALITLCRSLGIDATYVVARNRLAPPPAGALSAAGQFAEPLLRIQTDRGPVWLTVSSKYAPFGYIPAEIRGTPAYILESGEPKKTVTPSGGTEDSVDYEGKVALGRDGSAKLQLVQRFAGKYAMAVRAAFSQLPDAQLRDVIESKLLGRALRGARLVDYRLEHLDDLDEPLLLHMRAEMNGFAQNNGGELAIPPPFSPRVAQLAALPTRQTPLLIAEATHQTVQIEITLPDGAALASVIAPSTLKDGDRTVSIEDHLQGKALVLKRTLDIPAGRIQPDAYPSFLDFARRADAAMAREIRIKLGR
jgi:tetratricopeptide (TPR) repeat protein